MIIGVSETDKGITLLRKMAHISRNNEDGSINTYTGGSKETAGGALDFAINKLQSNKEYYRRYMSDTVAH